MNRGLYLKTRTEPSSPKSSKLADKEIIFGNNFVLNFEKKLGKGSFGEIYIGTNSKTNRQVAIKIESTKSRQQQLLDEGRVYLDLEGGVGIPDIHWCGREMNYNALVIDLLGPSLESLFIYCGKVFSLKTTLMVIDQMLTRVEYIHSRNYIHRDIKPENFLIGRGEQKSLIYIIDFGIAKRYKNAKTGAHISYKEGKGLIGTARYASINAHLGMEQSRRDDLESIGYIMICFLKGSLPWDGVKAKFSKDKYEKIKLKKQNTTIAQLCDGLPKEIQAFIQYVRGLKFNAKPDYDYLRDLIKGISNNNCIKFDKEFDWVMKNKEEINRL